MSNEQGVEQQTTSTEKKGGPIFSISGNRLDNNLSALPVQTTDVSTSQREVEELFASAIAFNPEVFGSSLTITRDQFDTYLHAKVGTTITLPTFLDIGKVDDELAQRNPVAPNGERYDPNDVQYLIDNGYSKEQAIYVLSQDKKYTTPTTKAESSETSAVNEKTLAARQAAAAAQNDATPSDTARVARVNELAAKVAAGTISASEYTEYSTLLDMSPTTATVETTTTTTTATTTATASSSTVDASRLSELSTKVDASTASVDERREYAELVRTAKRVEVNAALNNQ